MLKLNETQKKYKEALTTVVRLVLTNEFRANKFIKDWKISNLFVRAVIQLDYIDSTGAGKSQKYSTTLKPEDVTDEMAMRIQDRVKELAKQRNEKSQQNKKNGITRKWVSDKDKTPLKEKQNKEEVKGCLIPKEKLAEKKRDIPILQERIEEIETNIIETVKQLKLENSRTICMPKKDKAFYIVDEDKVVFKPLSDWTDEHLLIELSKRGYEGSLNKLTNNGCFSKMETIELGKAKNETKKENS